MATQLRVKTNEGMGWRPDLPDHRDHDYKVSLKSRLLGNLVLPDEIVIPDSQLPEVYDQRMTSSCVGNAISTMMTYVRKVQNRSRLFIYYEARRLINETDRDEGCYIRDGIKVIANLGAPRETLWPFEEKNLFVDPNVRADKDAALRKIFNYSRLTTRAQFRQCLAEKHPFVIGFSVYDNFMSSITARTGVVGMPKGSMSGGHAITVIGYISNFKKTQWAKDAIAAGFPEAELPDDVYVCRNSWGKGWGRNGNFVIPAAYLENPRLAADAWTIRNR